MIGYSTSPNIQCMTCLFSVGLQTNSGPGRLIVEVCRSHTHAHEHAHTAVGSPPPLETSDHPVSDADNYTAGIMTNVHACSGVRTRDLSNQSGHRPHGHRVRHKKWLRDRHKKWLRDRHKKWLRDRHKKWLWDRHKKWLWDWHKKWLRDRHKKWLLLLNEGLWN